MVYLAGHLVHVRHGDDCNMGSYRKSLFLHLLVHSSCNDNDNRQKNKSLLSELENELPQGMEGKGGERKERDTSIAGGGRLI